MHNIELVTYNRLFFDNEINYLTDTGELLSDEERERRFNNLPNMKDYKVFGVMYNKEPIGVCGLKHIISSQSEYFGFIGQKTLWEKSLAKLF